MKSMKVITVILALALCISVFAACTAETSVTESSATTKSAVEPTNTTTTVATEPVEPIKIYASTTSGLRDC